MSLRYDHQSGRYLGERLSIPEWVFVNRLQQLLVKGWEPNDALEQLLKESIWSAGVDGVTLLDRNPACRNCGAPLTPPRQIFCNVVCEAASYVDAQLYSSRPGD
ncbi:MAG: hypothetical protein ACYDCQ_18300 [Dehalococcoidia bacterium]